MQTSTLFGDEGTANRVRAAFPPTGHTQEAARRLGLLCDVMVNRCLHELLCRSIWNFKDKALFKGGDVWSTIHRLDIRTPHPVILEPLIRIILQVDESEMKRLSCNIYQTAAWDILCMLRVHVKDMEDANGIAEDIKAEKDGETITGRVDARTADVLYEFKTGNLDDLQTQWETLQQVTAYATLLRARGWTGKTIHIMWFSGNRDYTVTIPDAWNWETTWLEMVSKGNAEGFEIRRLRSILRQKDEEIKRLTEAVKADPPSPAPSDPPPFPPCYVFRRAGTTVQYKEIDSEYPNGYERPWEIVNSEDAPSAMILWLAISRSRVPPSTSTRTAAAMVVRKKDAKRFWSSHGIHMGTDDKGKGPDRSRM